MEKNMKMKYHRKKKKNQVFLLALSSRYPIFLSRDQHCHYALTDWLSQVNCIFSKFFCQAHLLTVLNCITRPGSEYDIRFKDYILLSFPSYTAMIAGTTNYKAIGTVTPSLNTRARTQANCLLTQTW